MNKAVTIDNGQDGAEVVGATTQPSILRAARGAFSPGQEKLIEMSQYVSEDPAEPATYHGMMARKRREDALKLQMQ